MSSTAPLVIISAGGTGGHVYPALAVAAELLQRGVQVEWLGTARGLEARVVPGAGIALHTVTARGLRGKNLLWKLLGVLGTALALLQALLVLWQRKPACVIGLGGYASAPAGVAAWLQRRPLLIHEQNAVAGTTNRLLAPLARQVFSAFDNAFEQEVGATTVGNPLRAELLQRAPAPWTYDGDRPLHLLVMGGSLGAEAINTVMPEALKRLHARGFAGRLVVRHQSGEAHFDKVCQRYGNLDALAVSVQPFIDDMPDAYTWADLVLCRAGALTVSELAAMGRPAMLVPLPQAIDDHQTANARHLADAGGGLLLRQDRLDAERLASAVGGFIEHPERLAIMARAATAMACRDAAQRIATACEQECRQ